MGGVFEKANVWIATGAARLRWYDWRVKSVFAATGIAVLLTVLIPFLYPSATNPSILLGASYASWLGGVALFALVGFVVAIASLARPEQESFDARARNLLRRQSGPHIDYIIGKLHNVLEPYVEETVRRMTIVDYDEVENKFYINHTTQNTTRSFIDDMAIKFPASLSYVDACPPPPGRNKGSLTHLKVNGQQICGYKEFEDKFELTFEGEVKKHSTCTVEHRLNYWIKASDEPNRHKPLRYTRSLKLIIQNKLPKMAIKIEVIIGNPEKILFVIPADESATVVNLTEIQPMDNVYDIRVSPN